MELVLRGRPMAPSTSRNSLQADVRLKRRTRTTFCGPGFPEPCSLRVPCTVDCTGLKRKLLKGRAHVFQGVQRAKIDAMKADGKEEVWGEALSVSSCRLM